MTAAENRIIRTLSKGPVDMNNTYETMSKVMGSKNPLFVQDEDIYGVPPPSNAGARSHQHLVKELEVRPSWCKFIFNRKTEDSTESEYSDSVTIYSSSSGYTTTEIPEKLQKKNSHGQSRRSSMNIVFGMNL
ncbi:unnamed protein product [Oikopleura dioica]|uniref:Uncharacterized protein n=1 Tax=Oikopleura dioica TaxID=34765 RepID=E4X8B3_OIKDI|nr:unnamed protein product [Oikopleura dioica]CBY31647.1 unnamed protein product [Oikopleura dioica]